MNDFDDDTLRDLVKRWADASPSGLEAAVQHAVTDHVFLQRRRRRPSAPLALASLTAVLVVVGAVLGARIHFSANSGGAILPRSTATPVTQSATSSPSAIPALEPAPRFGAAMAYDPATQTTILFGGQASDGLRGDTWSWDGHAWRQLAPPSSPPARAGAAMAYDPSARQLVLFGGSGVGGGDSGYLGDTWTWNGSAWRDHAGPAPSARGGAAMASDTAGGDVILFGGVSGGRGSVYLADTWRWTAGQWTQVSTPSAPSARGSAAMAYDPSSQSLVLYGGVAMSGTLNDTWLWSAHGWTQDTRSGPTVAYVAMASADGQAVLFGGQDASGAATDATWTHSVQGWQRAAPQSSPGARNQPALAFDAQRHVLVLFGGNGGSRSGAFLGGTWVLQGRSWQQVAGVRG